MDPVTLFGGQSFESQSYLKSNPVQTMVRWKTLWNRLVFLHCWNPIQNQGYNQVSWSHVKNSKLHYRWFDPIKKWCFWVSAERFYPLPIWEYSMPSYTQHVGMTTTPMAIACESKVQGQHAFMALPCERGRSWKIYILDLWLDLWRWYHSIKYRVICLFIIQHVLVWRVRLKHLGCKSKVKIFFQTGSPQCQSSTYLPGKNWERSETDGIGNHQKYDNGSWLWKKFVYHIDQTWCFLWFMWLGLRRYHGRKPVKPREYGPQVVGNTAYNMGYAQKNTNK